MKIGICDDDLQIRTQLLILCKKLGYNDIYSGSVVKTKI